MLGAPYGNAAESFAFDFLEQNRAEVTVAELAGESGVLRGVEGSPKGRKTGSPPTCRFVIFASF